jgi:hypothetical protein
MLAVFPFVPLFQLVAGANVHAYRKKADHYNGE